MNNKLSLLILLCLIVFACQHNEWTDSSEIATSERDLMEPLILKGKVRVKFKELPADLTPMLTKGALETGIRNLDKVAAQLGAYKIERVFPRSERFEARTRKEGLHLWYNLYFKEDVSVTRVTTDLQTLSEIEIIEPVYDVVNTALFSIPVIASQRSTGRLTEMPYNDPLLPIQWDFNNTGNQGIKGEFIEGADINLFKAWKLEKGKPNVIVAIVDTGIEEGHEDLQQNIWYNEKEQSGEYSVDDDGNGFIDDLTGLNDGPYPGNSHGTLVAGIIGAKNNNGVGGCGIAGGDTQDNGVKIMNILSSYYLVGFKYSADMGAVISNNSWMLPMKNMSIAKQHSFRAAMSYFIKYAGVDENGNQTGPIRGGIVVFAAANANNEGENTFPGPHIEEVVSVAAFGPNFRKASYSNYGSWIDLSAPGGEFGYELHNTSTGNSYGSAVGTSLAAPEVSGILGLLVSKFAGKGVTAEEILRRLYRGCRLELYDYNPSLIGKLGLGYIDAFLALSDEPLNDVPKVDLEQADELSNPIVLTYGDTYNLSYSISDANGDEMSYELVDSSGTVTVKREDDVIRLVITNNNEDGGEYPVKLIVTDALGESTTVVFNLYLEEKLPDEVEFWPNPMTNRLFMRMARDLEETVTLKFYNVGGKLVLTKTAEVKPFVTNEFRLKELSGGVYTVTVETSKGEYSRNIIKL